MAWYSLQVSSGTDTKQLANMVWNGNDSPSGLVQLHRFRLVRGKYAVRISTRLQVVLTSYFIFSLSWRLPPSKSLSTHSSWSSSHHNRRYITREIETASLNNLRINQLKIFGHNESKAVRRDTAATSMTFLCRLLSKWKAEGASFFTESNSITTGCNGRSKSGS
jgi:hypothetical protein